MAMAGRFVCVEKRRYESKAEAKGALRQFVGVLARKGRLVGRPKVFRCHACDGWHIGRNTGSRRKGK